MRGAVLPLPPNVFVASTGTALLINFGPSPRTLFITYCSWQLTYILLQCGIGASRNTVCFPSHTCAEYI